MLKHCSVQIPSEMEITEAKGVKEALVRCINKAGYTGEPNPNSSEFKIRVAKNVSFDSANENAREIRNLITALGSLFVK